jgi:hypothetical protein
MGTTSVGMKRIREKILFSSVLYGTMLVLPPVVIPDLDKTFWSLFVLISALYQALILISQTCVVKNSGIMKYLSSSAKTQFPSLDAFATAFGIQMSAFVHTTITAICAIYLMTTESDIHKDHMFGRTWLSQFVALQTGSVFLTELIERIRSYGITDNPNDNAMLIHHILSIPICYTVATTYGTYYSVFVHLSEISSPPLSIRWFMLQFNLANTPLFTIVQLLFVSTFFVFRIIMGYFYLNPILYKDLLPLALGYPISKTQFPLATGLEDGRFVQNLALTIIVLVGVFHLLNLFFFYRIIRMAFKASKKPVNASSEEREALLREQDSKTPIH